jgi:hypothetical protein
VSNIEHNILAAQISMHQWWVEIMEKLKSFAELQVNVPYQDFGDKIFAEWSSKLKQVESLNGFHGEPTALVDSAAPWRI